MSERSQQFERTHWSLALFSAREEPTQLADAVLAAANADREVASLTLDVLVNGNPALAAEMHGRLSTGPWWKNGTTVRLWSIPRSDKAHAWNHYLHCLMPDASLAFFMDGYVTIERNALALMADAIRERPQALAATSMPSTGRSAASLRRRFLADGGLHGNLYALTRATTQRLRDCGFRLPTGIYRNDSALGAALAFNLDPRCNKWNWDRIAVVPDAEYRVPMTAVTRLSDVHIQLKRRWRQAQGQLETMALKAHLADAGRPPSAWPLTVRELILNWANEHPSAARSLVWTDPLAWAALTNLRRTSEGAVPDGPAECLGQYSRSMSMRSQPLVVSEH